MNYGIKVPKTQAPDKNALTLHYPHQLKLEERIWTENYRQYISIDPAIRNLAIRVEKRYDDGQIVCLFSDKYDPLESVNVNIENKEVLSNLLFVNITNILNKLKPYFEETHYVIIERQMVQNYKATRVMQHLISYFMIHLQDKYFLASIYEIDSKLKGKMLECEKGIRENELKKWAVQKALELAEKRKDEYTIKLINKTRKKDDLADVLCQIEAFCIYMGFPKTE